jgi:hypothetical protein
MKTWVKGGLIGFIIGIILVIINVIFLGFPGMMMMGGLEFIFSKLFGLTNPKGIAYMVFRVGGGESGWSLMILLGSLFLLFNSIIFGLFIGFFKKNKLKGIFYFIITSIMIFILVFTSSNLWDSYWDKQTLSEMKEKMLSFNTEINKLVQEGVGSKVCIKRPRVTITSKTIKDYYLSFHSYNLDTARASEDYEPTGLGRYASEFHLAIHSNNINHKLYGDYGTFKEDGLDIQQTKGGYMPSSVNVKLYTYNMYEFKDIIYLYNQDECVGDEIYLKYTGDNERGIPVIEYDA